MKYFGTDGIRGVVGKKINENLIKKLGKAIVCYLNKHYLPKKIVVGNDSRITSHYIFAVLNSVLLKYGVETHNIGRCTSPCLAYVTRKNNFPLGLMISASHNPKEYNGLKFFNTDGEKVADAFEAEIELYMDKTKKLKINYAQSTNCPQLKNDYISMLKNIKKCNYPCIIDCANGGASDIARQVFASTKLVNCNPNGNNINENAGCTHIEVLSSLCRQKGLVGFAFDGDADRIIAVDKFGSVIDGDKILFILSKFFVSFNSTIVGTVNTNSALQDAVKNRNISLMRTPVGDKFIYQQMKKIKSMLGGEDSGHIIIKKYTNTGDGILTAICLMNILNLTNLDFNQLLTDYNEYAMAKANLNLTKPFKQTQNIKMMIDKYTRDGARIIIRPSGTEPVLRVFVEHKNKAKANKMLSTLVALCKTITKH